MWHHIADWLYKVTGIAGSGPWYGFWSGFGANFGEYAMVGGVLAWCRKHNCHEHRCYRMGRHPGDTGPVCRRHHKPNAPATTQIRPDENRNAG
jgi:hypothetical protein